MGAYPGQTVHTSGPATLAVSADRDRVFQVVANMLDNAAKYSPEGAPIDIAWYTDGSMGVLTVRDYGSGIPEESLPLLFTRFGRVQGARRRSGRSGTGLGLYLGKQLAEAMGGSLTLLETGDTGSVFCLKLPLFVTGASDR
jgi:signal transduction histidine kinase